MPDPEALKEKTVPVPPCAQANYQVRRHVLACVDASSFADTVLAHAAAVAMAIGARLTILRVLEPPSAQSPIDPVEWTLRHRHVEAELRARASHFGGLQTDTVVDDGPAAERICAWARDNAVDLTVLSRCGEGSVSFPGLGATTRRVAEIVSGSVLIVPSSQVGVAPIRFRKVLIPLDGSSRSECALPIGLGIAAAHHAEIVLIHAAPDIDLTGEGPPGAEAISLRDRLRRRNEQAGSRYLQRVRSRLPSTPSPRVRVLPSGDPRHALARAVVEEHIDLLLLSCTGHSGHPDMSVGSVADYLINHMDIPVLLVRGNEGGPPMMYTASSEGMPVRLPSRALA
jgi:nucleotide-binding universal stress UspA family protein